MLKISVIVPVHNSEEYLKKCVDSLLAQTMEEIEIILVDDCSTDSSRKLIEGYVRNNAGKVVSLYLDENIRQGGARNRGMEIAQGEYIAFVDSDDFVEPEMCNTLYAAAQGADMAGADYYIDDGKTLKVVTLNYGEGFEMTAERRPVFIFNTGYFWSRIYRADFLREYDLKFPEKVAYEDAYFNFLTALYARSAVYVPGKFYHYYQSGDSTIRTRNKPHLYHRIDIPSMIIEECRRRGIYDEFKDIIDQKYISMQMGNIRYTCLEQFDVPDLGQLNRIRLAVKKECPDFARSSYYKMNSFQLRCYLRLTLWNPHFAILGHKCDRLIDYLAIIAEKVKRSDRGS